MEAVGAERPEWARDIWPQRIDPRKITAVGFCPRCTSKWPDSMQWCPVCHLGLWDAKVAYAIRMERGDNKYYGPVDEEAARRVAVHNTVKGAVEGLQFVRGAQALVGLWQFFTFLRALSAITTGFNWAVVNPLNWLGALFLCFTDGLFLLSVGAQVLLWAAAWFISWEAMRNLNRL